MEKGFKKMKVLGIDFGDARVGVATSDYGENLATAQGTIKVSGTPEPTASKRLQTSLPQAPRSS